MIQYIKTQNLPVLFNELHLETLNNEQSALLWEIDALLPQTQCGLCGYADGCLPYAHAIVTKQEQTNLCVPGGDDTAKKISKLTHQPAQKAMPSKWAINPATNRPQEVRVVIDENACIGCTKCIPACPVDAIIGTAKHMHSIMTELCTGCELCIAPCPVDCISTIPYPRYLNDTERQQEQQSLKTRYYRHLNRIANDLKTKNTTPIISHMQSKLANTLQSEESTIIAQVDAKNVVELAKLRTQLKKLEKQLALKPDPLKQQQRETLQAQLYQLEHA